MRWLVIHDLIREVIIFAATRGGASSVTTVRKQPPPFFLIHCIILRIILRMQPLGYSAIVLLYKSFLVGLIYISNYILIVY